MKSKIVLLLPIRCILFFIVFISMMLITNKDLKELSNTWSVVICIINILLIVLLILLTKIKKSNLLELINYKKGVTTKKEILIMILIVLLIGMGGMYLAGLIVYQKIPYFAQEMIAPIPLWLAIIVFLLLPTTTAIAEDSLYLGVGVNNINNKYLKIIIPSFFFALQHSFIPFIFDIRFIIYRFLSFLPLTIILAYIYNKKKNPLPIMIAHGIIDLFTVVWILITSINPEFYQSLLNM